MKQFMVTYLGGDAPSSPEEGKENMQKFQIWLETLSSAVVKPMVPLENTHTIKPDGSLWAGSSTAMSGYSVIKAESMEKVVSYLKSCPFLGSNGTLEVAELP